ncbi:MAG: hypothetical protein GXP34_09020 [Actinobacteria bacterium]|nr:hypothetical protein [Actinomycetota bacterium]
MRATESNPRSTSGWEMACAWCPPEDSPFLGGTPERRGDADTFVSATAEGSITGTRRRWRIIRWPYS